MIPKEVIDLLKRLVIAAEGINEEQKKHNERSEKYQTVAAIFLETIEKIARSFIR